MYLLHSMLPAFKKKVERSRKIIAEFREVSRKPAVSVSFGKDSECVMDLMLESDPNTILVWSDRGEEAEYPETYELVEKLKERYQFNLHTVYPKYTMFEIYRKFGLVEIEPGLTKSIIKHINVVEPMKRFSDDNGIDGSVTGLRIEESRGRAMMGKIRGPLFYGKERGMWIANPILYWSGRDVWAYIVSRELPYHPIYDKNPLTSREKTRLSNWSGLYNHHLGRVVELQLTYPELYQKLVNEFPEVSRLV